MEGSPSGRGAGFVAGVLSNLITVFLNTLMTTSKRVIRMFREGFMSLLRALKTLAMPPKGMTFREGAHEALKVICAGAVVIGGVALEEFIEKSILTILVWDSSALSFLQLSSEH